MIECVIEVLQKLDKGQLSRLMCFVIVRVIVTLFHWSAVEEKEQQVHLLTVTSTLIHYSHSYRQKPLFSTRHFFPPVPFSRNTNLYSPHITHPTYFHRNTAHSHKFLFSIRHTPYIDTAHSRKSKEDAKSN